MWKHMTIIMCVAVCTCMTLCISTGKLCACTYSLTIVPLVKSSLTLKSHKVHCNLTHCSFISCFAVSLSMTVHGVHVSVTSKYTCMCAVYCTSTGVHMLCYASLSLFLSLSLSVNRVPVCVALMMRLLRQCLITCD